MDAFRFNLIVFLIYSICYETRVTSDCVLTVNKDFGNPTPVFLKNGQYVKPSASGVISLSRSEAVQVACPGDKRHIVLGDSPSSYQFLEAHCIINSTFRVDRWIGLFKDIRCNSQPWFTTEETTEKCFGSGKIYKVGYKIKGVLHSLYEVCFDKYNLHTNYVKHKISPSTLYIQRGLSRPQFIEGSLFNKVTMSSLFKFEYQKTRLEAILGNNMADKYISKQDFLTRGHLAARADFTLGAETRATFHYVNTAPQWMRNNRGDWAALEEALRRRVHALGIDVTVFTGTNGVMTLPGERGEPREIYLTTDDNNNGLVPVPMYYYKLVYYPEQKKATAFITINSSFYNTSMTRDLQFCDDVCEQNPKFKWLTWRPKDGAHSFCCDYNQFVTIVDYLPNIDVKGLFY